MEATVNNELKKSSQEMINTNNSTISNGNDFDNRPRPRLCHLKVLIKNLPIFFKIKF